MPCPSLSWSEEMPLITVSGDPLLTRAQCLMIGHNAKGRTELGTLETQLLNRYPAAFASYTRLCKQQRLQSGGLWTWRDSQPTLLFAIVRASSVGATRIRYVQSIVMRLARDYRMEGIKSLAIAPLGNPTEWPEVKSVVTYWLRESKLPVVIYERYLPSVQAEENI